MKVFQFKFFCQKGVLLKRTLLQLTLLLCLFNLHAQDKNNIKLGVEAGILPSSKSDNLGFFLNAEPKLKVSENTFFGLRIGMVINSHSVENFDISQFSIDERSDNGGISLVPTIEYYLNKNNFRPYLGIGIGPYLLTNYIDVFAYSSQNVLEATVKSQVGLLVRGGWESDRIRLGLEYNFISKANIQIPDDQKIGSVDNSFLGLSIGFTIKGRKNPK